LSEAATAPKSGISYSDPVTARTALKTFLAISRLQVPNTDKPATANPTSLVALVLWTCAATMTETTKVDQAVDDGIATTTMTTPLMNTTDGLATDVASPLSTPSKISAKALV
jgi:hypothetical protein